MAKTTVLFQCSEEFKEALAQYAHNHKVSVAIVIREVVAAKIGYDISQDVTVDGRRKYANDEARREAQREKQRRQRAAVNALADAFGSEERRAAVQILIESLKNKGVDLSDI